MCAAHFRSTAINRPSRGRSAGLKRVNTGSREPEKPETRPSTGLAQPRVYLFTKQGEVDGLGQQPGRTAFYRLPPGFGIAVGGDHDDGDVGSHLPDFWQHLKPGHAGHVNVR